MNDPNAFGYQESAAATARPPGANPMAQYKFSTEELRVLQECNRESFVQRSLPLSVALGFSTFVGVQKGYFKPNPRFGAFPKVSLAVAAGYFLGKLSYQQACAEKLMSLPGSYIGQLLRDRRDGKIEGAAVPSQSSGAMFGAKSGDIYSDAGPGSALNLDTDRPLFTGDDSYRPDNEATGPRTGAAELAPRPSLSYDELRRRNRGDHDQNKQDPYRVDPGASPLVSRPRPPPPPPSAPVNKYGDSME